MPVDRVVKKTNNVRDASMGDFETWQRIAMFMGVNKYSLGLEGGPSEGAVDASSQRIALDKKMEEYGVTTEKEVVRIDKGKEVFSLNKNQQVKILLDLGYSSRQIKNMSKEADRVEMILKQHDKNSKRINKLIVKYPEDIANPIRKRPVW